MTKRANKKIQGLVQLRKKLTPEVKAMLQNRKKQLTKRYKEELKFLDKLLAKPTSKMLDCKGIVQKSGETVVGKIDG